MKLLPLCAGLLLLATPALAKDMTANTVTLSATSNTAMAITGDVVMDDDGVTFADGTEMEFSQLVGDSMTDDGVDYNGSVYEVATPEDPELLNGNRLCGGDVTYMAFYAGTDPAQTVLAVFTTPDVPASTEDACAIYLYD